MKKLLMASVLILLVCSVVFAEGYNKWFIAANPYSFQHFSNGTNAVKTKYGVGGAVGYGYTFDFEKCGLVVGADVLADTYFIEGRENFTDVAILAKVGYIFGSVQKRVDFYGLFKYGIDLQCFEGSYSAVQTYGHELGMAYYFTDRWSVSGALEVLFAAPKKDDVNYLNIRFNPYIGVGYSY